MTKVPHRVLVAARDWISSVSFSLTDIEISLRRRPFSASGHITDEHSVMEFLRDSLWNLVRHLRTYQAHSFFLSKRPFHWATSCDFLRSFTCVWPRTFLLISRSWRSATGELGSSPRWFLNGPAKSHFCSLRKHSWPPVSGFNAGRKHPCWRDSRTVWMAPHRGR